jgi:mono/diheme cytochrome c family protein
MRLLAKILGGVALVVLLALSTIWVFSTNSLNKHYEVSDAVPSIPRDSASIERGRHIARAITLCVDCHGSDLGGQVLGDDMPFARLVAPNLTSGRGGLAGSRTAEDMVRAVRHGVSVSGRALAIMPSQAYWHLGDEDVAALVAWVRSVAPVDRELPPTDFGLVGRALVVSGKLDAMFEAKAISHTGRREAPPPADTTAAYGKYLAHAGGCVLCHGPSLSGGLREGGPPGSKPAANLTPQGIGSWTEQDFTKALREGVRPAGTAIDSTQMPLRREMTDLEIRALFMFLRTLPPKGLGEP